MRSPFRPAGQRPPHLTIRAAADGEATIHLYDEIGYFGIQARTFVPQLQALDATTIHLRVNSPGGDVFDGTAIYNALKAHPARVITHVDGLAASIASVIALAGDEVRMADNSFLMVHHPWGLTIGNAAEHRQTADTLDKVAGSLVGTYMQASGQDRQQILDWMDAETWFTAEEAVAAGFADQVETGQPVEQRFDLSVFQHPPAALAARALAPAAASERPTVREVERLLRDAGLSRAEARTAGRTLRDAGLVSDSLREAGEAAPSEERRDAAAELIAAGSLAATIQSLAGA